MIAPIRLMQALYDRNLIDLKLEELFGFLWIFVSLMLTAEALLKEGSVSRGEHKLNGTTVLVWHVDNDDDRYVSVQDSVGSGDFLLIVRDHRDVSIGVFDDPRAVVRFLDVSLLKLSSSSKEKA